MPITECPTRWSGGTPDCPPDCPPDCNSDEGVGVSYREVEEPAFCSCDSPPDKLLESANREHTHTVCLSTNTHCTQPIHTRRHSRSTPRHTAHQYHSTQPMDTQQYHSHGTGGPAACDSPCTLRAWPYFLPSLGGSKSHMATSPCQTATRTQQDTTTNTPQI